MADIASAIFIRQSPDFSGLCGFWGLRKSSNLHPAPWVKYRFSTRGQFFK
jgi:hypothetical protein